MNTLLQKLLFPLRVLGYIGAFAGKMLIAWNRKVHGQGYCHICGGVARYQIVGTTGDTTPETRGVTGRACAFCHATATHELRNGNDGIVLVCSEHHPDSGHHRQSETRAWLLKECFSLEWIRHLPRSVPQNPKKEFELFVCNEHRFSPGISPRSEETEQLLRQKHVHIDTIARQYNPFGLF